MNLPKSAIKMLRRQLPFGSEKLIAEELDLDASYISKQLTCAVPLKENVYNVCLRMIAEQKQKDKGELKKLTKLLA